MELTDRPVEAAAEDMVTLRLEEPEELEDRTPLLTLPMDQGEAEAAEVGQDQTGLGETADYMEAEAEAEEQAERPTPGLGHKELC
jgi:hypothetical protein